MRKFFLKIHLWLSIPLGIIVTIVCLSGAILVFQDEIEHISNHDRYYIKENLNSTLPINELVNKVNTQFPDNSVASVTVPSDTNKNYVFGLKEGRISVYVNPHTGDVIDTTQRGGDSFFGFMMRLHRWLLDSSRSVGKAIVGYTTIFFVVIILTGIFIWWPKSRKQLKNRLQVKTKYGAKRFWLDMHTTVGMYVFVGLLTLSLTGLTYSFQWYSKGFYSMFGVETAPSNGKDKGQNNAVKKERKEKAEDKSSFEQTSKWDNVLVDLRTLNPQFKAISIQDGTASVVQDFTFGNSRASDKYSFDNATGKIIRVKLYKDQDKQTKIRGWVYSIHVGSWGGLFSKILTCVVALIGASLPITGYYMFYIKRKSKFKLKKKIA